MDKLRNYMGYRIKISFVGSHLQMGGQPICIEKKPILSCKIVMEQLRILWRFTLPYYESQFWNESGRRQAAFMELKGKAIKNDTSKGVFDEKLIPRGVT